MLNQDADEPFKRAHQSPVDHDWAMIGIVRSGIIDIKSFGQIKVHLDGGALPGPPQLIFYLDVNLRSIKNAFTRIFYKVEAFFLKSLLECFCCLLPVLV